MLHKFKRGVHPPDEKSRTVRAAIRDAPIPDILVVPLSQHTGASAVPIVGKGVSVDKGMLIGEPGGFISAAVHSPVSGEVVAVEDRALPIGRPGACVIIRNDREERWAPEASIQTDPASLEAGSIRDRVRAAGVVGMGGAAFPTSVKLTPPDQHVRIDTLIVNAAECEPYLTGDYRLMLESPERIVRGAELVRRAAGAQRIVYAVEDDKEDAAKALAGAAGGAAGVGIVLLPVRYPQGAEKNLIESVTGREVPSGGLPMNIGVLVQNVATCAAVCDACAFGRPLIERIVTVTGPCTANPGNFRVRIGTLYSDLLKEVGLAAMPRRIVLGGPMMGVAQTGLDIPVTKATTGLVFLDEVPRDEWRSCIRCGKCVRACPVRIMPSELSVLVEAERIDEANALDLFDCIECGCCAYVCPTRRPIVHRIKYAKAQINARREGAAPPLERTPAK